MPAPAERLILWALRGWVSLRLAGEAPQADIGRAMSQKTSARAGALFVAWIQAVEAASRRPIQIQCPVCGGISTDEQRLIVACGIAPMAFELGEQLLEPMLLEAQPVMVLARSLNVALAAEGWPLPARLVDPAFDHPTTTPTLH